MDGDFHELVNKLQDQIHQGPKTVYDDTDFYRWLNMRYMGRIKDPDGYAKITGRCGDTMEIFLKFEDGRVKNASFLTDGCVASAVCGSFAVKEAIGRSPDELLDVTAEAILSKLEGFPSEEEHCAYLAAETLHLALQDYMTKQVRKEKSNKIT